MTEKLIAAFYRDEHGRSRAAVVLHIYSDGAADLRCPQRSLGQAGIESFDPRDPGPIFKGVPYHDAKMGLPLPSNTWSLPFSAGLSFW